MATQTRARKGGEWGINGDFYEGGKFMPNTDKSKSILESIKKSKKISEKELEKTAEMLETYKTEYKKAIKEGNKGKADVYEALSLNAQRDLKFKVYLTPKQNKLLRELGEIENEIIW